MSSKAASVKQFAELLWYMQLSICRYIVEGKVVGVSADTVVGTVAGTACTRHCSD